MKPITPEQRKTFESYKIRVIDNRSPEVVAAMLRAEKAQKS